MFSIKSDTPERTPSTVYIHYNSGMLLGNRIVEEDDFEGGKKMKCSQLTSN